MTVKLKNVVELVGSGELLEATQDYAIQILKAVDEKNLPVSLEDDTGKNIVNALFLVLEGLQDPESELFIDKQD